MDAFSKQKTKIKKGRKKKEKEIKDFRNNIYIACEINGSRNKNFLLEEYFDKIKPYLRDITIRLQEPDTWKIQLAIVINFISSKDAKKSV